MTMRLGRVLMAAAAALSCAQVARAADDVPLPPHPPPAPGVALPPYQAELDRLAELLGTLAFMRTLCGEGDGAAWRGRMDALLDAEGTTEARRDRLAGSYNRGYQGYQATYRRCTPAAQTVIARALTQGAALSGEVSKRFGRSLTGC